MIKASGLKKSFGTLEAVKDVSLDIQPGEIYGLVGADGAGKTTTLRLLVGALKADAGTVEICGFDVGSQLEQARSQVGYLSQKFSLYEDLTVLENIHFFAEVRGMPRSEWQPRSDEILDFVGLSEFKERFAGKLSGGMKQKLGLATALVANPRVLLLDEPTTGVDPVTRQDFWKLIIKLSTENGSGGYSVLLTTPYMDEAARCNRIGFMKAGKIIREGTPTQMRESFANSVIEVQVDGGHQIKDILSKIVGVEDVRTFGDRLHLIVRLNEVDQISSLATKEIEKRGFQIKSLRKIPPTLEDAFISLSAYDEGRP